MFKMLDEITEFENWFLENITIICPLNGKISKQNLKPIQKKLLLDLLHENISVKICARQQGVSTLISCLVLWKLSQSKPIKILYVSPTTKMCENFINSMRLLTKNFEKKLQFNNRFKNGSVLNIRYMDSLDQLIHIIQQYDLIVFDCFMLSYLGDHFKFSMVQPDQTLILWSTDETTKMFDLESKKFFVDYKLRKIENLVAQE